MGLRNKVIAGAVALAIGVGGYFGIGARNTNLAEDFAKQNRPIVGTVLAESYQNTLVPNPKFDGLVSYSNETVKLEPKYTLKVRTDDGRTIGVSIINSEPYGTATKESLDALIEEGTRISFPRGNMRATNFFMGSAHNYDERETSFQDDTQMGTKRAYRVQVLDKE
jgi:hypothetical protein